MDSAKQKSFSRRGFTLIELLVVIAIIALLAAILFPVFARARENARRSSCQNNLKSIALGFHQYAQDYDEKYPLPAWQLPNQGYGSVTDPNPLTSLAFTWGLTPKTSWVDSLQPYIKSTQILFCPSDTKAGLYPQGGNHIGWISYGMNSSMNGLAYQQPPYSANEVDRNYITYGPDGALHGQSLAKIISPSYKVLVADMAKKSPASGVTVQGATTYTFQWDVTLDMDFDTNTAYGSGAVANQGPYTTGRHFGGANIAFADGHVKWMNNGVPGLFYRDSGTEVNPSGSYNYTANYYYGASKEGLRFWCPYDDGGL